ncbi:hypothetical protein [Pandoraea pnomenusa]|uniref:hypothetical protein n=1 Tax=Pandoraea pnomenusa TaxID=93220 RepID=UPI001ACF8D60|nr:hypothetical protein [Pandoraea pnomenusa]MBN9096487.1 hypothetical protein [Pandoraea pnomenusa]
MSEEAAKEFSAIKTVHDALEPLDEEARTRVLTYITSLLGIDAKVTSTSAAFVGAEADHEEEAEVADDEAAKDAPTFSTFAELYAAASPKSNGERALVVGYWLQVCQEAENFTAASANKELTHLGHKVANITDAIDSMKNQKPMLILQLKKSGNSRQARKLYKVSHEGIKRVEGMIGG